MSNWELLMAGVKLMIFGMGMVYVFLVIMIYTMKLMEKVLRPYAARFEPAPAPTRSKAKAKIKTAGTGDEQALAAAAVAAVHAAVNGGPVAKAGAFSQTAAVKAPAQETVVKAPLPGTVMKILAEDGAEVEAGEAVIVLEAMKMETEIKAPCRGVITAVEVAVGQIIASDAELFRIEEK